MGILLLALHQSYQPVLDSLFLSALVAGLPLYVLFVMLAVLRLPAWLCAPHYLASLYPTGLIGAPNSGPVASARRNRI